MTERHITRSKLLSGRPFLFALVGFLGVLILGCDDHYHVGFGVLTVTTRTSGTDQDRDGYRLTVQGRDLDESVRLDRDDTVTFTFSRSGERVITLRDVAPNCEVDRNPRFVELRRQQSRHIRFEIFCR